MLGQIIDVARQPNHSARHENDGPHVPGCHPSLLTLKRIVALPPSPPHLPLRGRVDSIFGRRSTKPGGAIRSGPFICGDAFRKDFEMDELKRRIRRPFPRAEHDVGDGFKAPTLADIQTLARAKTEAAVTVLAAIMYRETANAFARVAAAKELLYWGWGRPALPTAADGGPSELLHRIERVIVHPDHSSEAADRIDQSDACKEAGNASQ
jgi:hypothetical protein